MSTGSALTIYEGQQLHAIKAWQDEKPGVLSQALGMVAKPMAWFMTKIIPEAAIRGALSASNTAARWMTDTADIVRDAHVEAIADLKDKDLELSDRLADEVHNWAIGIAAVEGTATGFFGVFSVPVDVPAIITLALRTIHKIGVCYGYECKTERDEQFVLGILSASGSNSMDEKVAALATLKAIQMALLSQTWKTMAEKAAQSQLSKEAVLISIRSLAKQLGINITKRKALAAIPVVGAAIGGTVNGCYIKDVGWAARRMFQERWLKDNGKSGAASQQTT